jgi:hypothetical protein
LLKWQQTQRYMQKSTSFSFSHNFKKLYKYIVSQKLFSIKLPELN